MISCCGCKHRNCPQYCACCVGWDKYESNTLINPVLAMDIDKEMKMLAKHAMNKIFGVERVERRENTMTIKKVYFNDPVTVVLWEDGTKTIVKCDGEKYDPEKGLAMAIAKKALGNKGNYYEVFKKWLPEEEDDDYEDHQVEQMKDYIDELEKEFHKNKRSYRNREEADVTEDTIKDEPRQIQWLSTKEVADANGLSVKYVRKQIKDGFIPSAKKVGGKWKIPGYVFDDHEVYVIL